MVELSAPDFGGFEVLGELGRGSTGVVYKVRDGRIDRISALKSPLLTVESERIERRQRFLREAQALGSFEDPGIPCIQLVGECKGVCYYVREYVEGETLARRVTSESISWKNGIKVLETVANTVQRVHARGLVHRNLHELNVLLTSNGEPKLIGFGLVGMSNLLCADIREILGVPLTDDLDALQRMVRWVCSKLKPPTPQARELIRESHETKNIASLVSVLTSFL